MKYLFIINPAAGKQNPMDVLGEDIRAACERSGLDYEIKLTEHQGHATEIAHKAAEAATAENPVRVFSVGGDGTLCETANALFGAEHCELGCIPCGSGNDFNKTFGTKEEFLDVEKYILCPSVAVDGITSQHMNAINICSLGLDANICDHANRIKENNKKLSGPKAYNKAVVKGLLGRIYNTLKITIDDDRVIEGKYLFSLAANGQYYGSGWRSAPVADPSDGQLDFIFINKMTRLRALTVIPAYKSGKYFFKKKYKNILTHIRGKKIRIQSVKPSVVNIDGECAAINDITFEVMPGALRFIVPQSYIDARKNSEEK
ncbi:MAG: hypothetical protein E7554_10560 [Ruminococcaceae bacterium]|nr:hypothetical protein [Oscillospiraceae bacterium]